jgi:hypothetical protein
MEMRALCFSSAAVMIFFLVLVGCKEDQALYDMAEFDRMYIPALELTGKPDTSGEAVMAIKDLKVHFSIIKSRYSDRSSWDEASKKVEDLIMKADSSINAGDYKGAHASLEGIRHVMLDLRRDEGYEDYILDRMTEFHEVMEKIYGIARANDPLTNEAVLEIDRALPRARALWDQVTRTNFDHEMFRMGKSKMEDLTVQFEKERALLDKLSADIRSGDREGAREAALAIKSEYAKAFKLFGKFGGSGMGK